MLLRRCRRGHVALYAYCYHAMPPLFSYADAAAYAILLHAIDASYTYMLVDA